MLYGNKLYDSDSGLQKIIFKQLNTVLVGAVHWVIVNSRKFSEKTYHPLPFFFTGFLLIICHWNQWPPPMLTVSISIILL